MKKPSSIKVIRAKAMPKLMGKRFAAITLFGIIYTKTQAAADIINSTDSLDSTLETHEMVHVKQAVSTRNSWFFFYLNYICEWLFNLPLLFVKANAPYKFLPLELDAYRHERNTEYALQDKCTGWRQYKKLTLTQRRKLAKQWFNNKKQYNYSFLTFLQNEVDHLIS